MTKNFYRVSPEHWQALVDELSPEAFAKHPPIFHKGQLVDVFEDNEWIPAIVVGEMWILDESKMDEQGVIHDRIWEYVVQPLTEEDWQDDHQDDLFYEGQEIYGLKGDEIVARKLAKDLSRPCQIKVSGRLKTVTQIVPNIVDMPGRRPCAGYVVWFKDEFVNLLEDQVLIQRSDGTYSVTQFQRLKCYSNDRYVCVGVSSNDPNYQEYTGDYTASEFLDLPIGFNPIGKTNGQIYASATINSSEV